MFMGGGKGAGYAMDSMSDTMNIGRGANKGYGVDLD
jgi:hypothetical protein